MNPYERYGLGLIHLKRHQVNPQYKYIPGKTKEFESQNFFLPTNVASSYQEETMDSRHDDVVEQ